MKKFISLALALLLIFSLGVSSFAAPVVKKAQVTEESDIDKQVDFIFNNIADLSQDSADGLWSYAVTDLDHNGNLELVAAICRAPEYYTYAKVFEVSPERDAFIECDMSVEEGKPFIDIIRDSSDTFYDKANDTWYYLFSEDYTKSTSEYYSVKCSVSLKDGYVTPASYATEHCEIVNGVTAVTYEDMNGNLITPDEFNKAGTEAFKDFEKSGTNFSWFSLKDATSCSVLHDSYKVFAGEKEPAASAKGAKNNITIVPAPKDSPFMVITKNPTSESCRAGSTIYFVTTASNATSYIWWFTSPTGDEFSLQEFCDYFNTSVVSGANSSTLTIKNVTDNMNNWGAYCICSGNGQTARSSTAYIYVTSYSADYTWTCDNCGTWNKDSSTSCSKCGRYRYSDYTWTCNSCGTWNKDSSTYCSKCGTSRYSDYTWTCDNCGAWNKDSSQYCASCGVSRYSSFTWTCDICGTWNKESSQYCSACGSSRNAGFTWTCDVCGTWNREEYNTCYNCGSSRYYAPVGPISDYTWTCDYCGAWNKDSAYTCSSCGSSRYAPVGPVINPMSDYTWTCNICGTWNLDSAYSCSSCGSSRYAQPVTPIIPVDPYPTISSGSDYTWTCDSCGAWNLDSSYVCANCGGLR